MILTGKEIEAARLRGEIEITPFQPQQINPNSYDLRLDEEMLVYKTSPWKRLGRFLGLATPDLDVRVKNPTEGLRIPTEGLILEPGRVYLGCTEEILSSDTFVSVVDGKSSIGRLGLFIHVTAGYVDIGYRGQVTLELVATQPIRVYAGMRIAQVRYHRVEGEVSLYQGNYVGETALGPAASRSWNQF